MSDSVLGFLNFKIILFLIKKKRKKKSNNSPNQGLSNKYNTNNLFSSRSFARPLASPVRFFWGSGPADLHEQLHLWGSHPSLRLSFGPEARGQLTPGSVGPESLSSLVTYCGSSSETTFSLGVLFSMPSSRLETTRGKPGRESWHWLSPLVLQAPPGSHSADIYCILAVCQGLC